MVMSRPPKPASIPNPPKATGVAGEAAPSSQENMDMSQKKGDGQNTLKIRIVSSPKANPIPLLMQKTVAVKRRNKGSHGSSRHLPCDHKARRTQCAICSGGSVCAHGKQKHLCKECGGKSLCSHMRQRSKCKLCNES